MSALSLLSMMGGGGALPIPRIPCAFCVAELAGVRRDPAQLGDPADEPDEPAQGATIVAGTLVCLDHVREAVDRIDAGHVAAAVRDGMEAVAGELARATDQLDRLTMARA